MQMRFNCKYAKPNRFRLLAPEYGGVLFEYEGSRFLDAPVIDLFRRLEQCGSGEFVDNLRWLQPDKRWSAGKELYWFNGSHPIHGVLATLLGAMAEDTPTGKARRRVVARLFGLEHISVTEPWSQDVKCQIMLRALQRKFEIPMYRSLLLETGDEPLHLSPVVGSPDMWTWRNGEGGDWMGKLLTQIRNEIR